jgi:hypothetical protein
MSLPYLRAEGRGMDILSDYRITALIASERELAQRAEQVRIADERAQLLSRRPTAATGPACIPTTSH